MTISQSILEDDAAAMIDDFGESVVYRPRAGGTRTITAIVSRNQPGVMAETPNGSLMPENVVAVLNDSTRGIASTEIDTGGDQIDIVPRVGQSAVTKSIVRICDHDAAMLWLEVR